MSDLLSTVRSITAPLDPEVAKLLHTPGPFPKIRVPPAPPIEARIAALAKDMLEHAKAIREEAFGWKHDEARTDLDALIHEAEHASRLLHEKLHGDEDSARAAVDLADQITTERLNARK